MTIHTPILDNDIDSLHIGDTIMLSDKIYCGRDGVLPKICELIRKNELKTYDIDLQGSRGLLGSYRKPVIFYTGRYQIRIAYTSGKAYGDTGERVSKAGSIARPDDDPGKLESAPILIRNITEDVVRLHLLMFGSDPTIRTKTYRVFHKHSVQTVLDEIVD